MKTSAKTSLIAAAFLFSARLLGAADAP